MTTGLFIGALAKRLGVTPKTIRYYEAAGLLDAAARSHTGYRLYATADVERLRFILDAKALGLSLADIRGILDVWAHGERPCAHVSRLLDEKLADLDRRIAELSRFRDALGAYKARVDAAPSGPETPCKHIAGVATGEWQGTPPAVELH